MMTFAVLSNAGAWEGAGVFVLFGLLTSVMAWRTWHGKTPLPVRTRPGAADFVFGVNTFGRWFVSGNLSIAAMFLTLPISLTILHFNEGTHLIVVHIILWPLEVLCFTLCVLSGITVFTLALFSWPEFLIPPKWRHLPGETTDGARTRSRSPR
jgi:hypothetical protein